MTLRENILICGSEVGHTVFFDIRKPSEIMSIFYKSQTENVCQVEINDRGLLLISNEDLSTVLYDLSKADEDEALEYIINPDDCAIRLTFNNDCFVFEGSVNKVQTYNIDTGSKIINYQYLNSVKLKGGQESLLHSIVRAQ